MKRLFLLSFLLSTYIFAQGVMPAGVPQTPVTRTILDYMNTANRSIILSAAGGIGGLSTTEIRAPKALATTFVDSLPYRTVKFAADSTRYMSWQVYMPSNWDTTSSKNITYKVYWGTDTLATADTIWWALGMTCYQSTDTLGTAKGAPVQVVGVTQTETGITTNRIFQTAESGALTPGGKKAPSCLATFRLARIRYEAPLTSYTKDAKLYWVRVSYPINNYSDR